MKSINESLIRYHALSKEDKLIYHQHLRDERSHMENLVNQRFNFLVIVFGFVVASFPYVNTPNQLRIVLISGFIFVAFFTLLIGRAQRRFDENLRMMYRMPTDPAKDIKEWADKGKRFNPYTWPAKLFVGYVIPIILFICLACSLCLEAIKPGAIFDFIKSEKPNGERIIYVSCCNSCADSKHTDTLLIPFLNKNKMPN